MPPFSLIAAISHDGALGQQGGLPWPVLLADRQWFRWLTSSRNPYTQALCIVKHPEILTQNRQESFWPTDRNAVIMGKRTWPSLPGRTLPGRDLYVLTRHPWTWLPDPWPPEVTAAADLAAALQDAHKERAPNIFIAGGAALYAEALQHPDCQTLYLTEVDGTYPEADTWWPESRIEWAMGRMQTWGDTRKKARAWHRTHSSAWITEPERPRYRFGIWAPA